MSNESCAICLLALPVTSNPANVFIHRADSRSITHRLHLDCLRTNTKMDRLENRTPFRCPLCRVPFTVEEMNLLVPLRKRLSVQTVVRPLDDYSEYFMVLYESFNPGVSSDGGGNKVNKIHTWRFQTSPNDPIAPFLPNSQSVQTVAPSQTAVPNQTTTAVPNQVVHQTPSQTAAVPNQTTADPNQAGPSQTTAAPRLTPLRKVLRESNSCRTNLKSLDTALTSLKHHHQTIRTPRRKMLILNRMAANLRTVKQNLMKFNGELLDFLLAEED